MPRPGAADAATRDGAKRRGIKPLPQLNRAPIDHAATYAAFAGGPPVTPVITRAPRL